MRRPVLQPLSRIAFAMAVLSTLAAMPAAGSSPPRRRPNVVFIVLDDMNGYALLSQYPGIRMPSLDRLKNQSVNFVNAACSVTVCNPSRASFLSGLNPSSNGAYLNGADVWDKPGSVCEKIQSLPEYFKAHGYTTWGGGKLFHSPLPRERLAAMFDVQAEAKNGFGPQPNPAHPILAPGVQPWQGPDADFPDVENDVTNLNKHLGGYPTDIRFTQSCIKESAERYDSGRSYRSLEKYSTVQSLLDAAKALPEAEIINVLCWGSLTEPAVLVNHCLATGQAGVLKKLRFIAHWTNSSFRQGSKEHPEDVANCREDAAACAYLKEMAFAGKITYPECGAIGQRGAQERKSTSGVVAAHPRRIAAPGQGSRQRRGGVTSSSGKQINDNRIT